MLYKRRDYGYEKITRLGDMFIYAYEHDYYTERLDDEVLHLSKSCDGSEALRIVYMTLLYYDFLSYKDRKMIEPEVAWSSEPNERDVVFGAFFKSSFFISNNIANMDEAVSFLNQYEVNPVIKAESNNIFRVLEEGCISKGSLFYYHDGGKGIFPESYQQKVLRELYLGDPEILKMDDGYLDIDIGECFMDHHSSRDGKWIYYAKVDLTDGYGNYMYNTTTRKKLRINGRLVDDYDGRLIIVRNNVIYRYDGNDVSLIYRMTPYEYVVNKGYSSELIIMPVIRGAFLPYRISKDDGEFLGYYTTIDKYVWYSIISLEASLYEQKELSDYDFCENDRYPNGAEFGLQKCTIGEILKFIDRISVSNEKMAESLKTLARLLHILECVVDLDADISELLLAIRQDYIKENQAYFDDVISKKFGWNFEECREECKREWEYPRKDLFRERFDDKVVIGFEYSRYISNTYVDMIAKKYMNGEQELKDYISDIWFGGA